jgi:prepilin-type N-terminal cleavage/methylation domain-containing protein
MRYQSRAGFTLIELLIVVVIIGILAAIAVPKFGTTKGKAYSATLKSDLRNLATAQEAYYYDNATYAANLSDLNIIPSTGVTMNIAESTAAGWSATATHTQSTPTTCAVFFGAAAAVAPATAEGRVTCQ